tara:strand:- start:414 stop:965 length:552 start_codon:yes stop_codon:yes gene_type:complete
MTTDIDFLVETDIHKQVQKKISSMNIKIPDINDPRREGFDKFWAQMLDDLKFYEKHIDKKNPLDKTCYKSCHKCLKCFDHSFWNYTLTGYRKHVVITPYKYPGKVFVVFLVFLAGVFKMLRANQDGKASFYGTIITLVGQMSGAFLLAKDHDYVMILPKFAGFVVAIIILNGIVQNADGELGL